jgi:L-fuculose-phosphate aldolase
MSTAKARRRARAAIVEFGLRMQDERLAYWTSGNLSVRVAGDPDQIALSPTDVPYDSVDLEDVPIVRLDGTVVDGGRAPT